MSDTEQGRNWSVRREIAESWNRVRRAGLSPAGGVIEEAGDFDPRSRFLHAASPVMDSLRQELDGTGVGVLLADRSAIIVDRTFGSRAMERGSDDVGAVVGAQFTEELSGTNAIATPHETRTSVSIRGEEHYLDAMKEFRCLGMPIIHPVTNRLEGVFDLMTDEPMDEPLMRFIAARAVHEVQRRLVDDMDSRTAAAVKAFHTLTGHTPDPLILFGEDYVLNSRSSLTHLDTSDHRDLAVLSEDMRPGDEVVRMTLTSGRTVRIRVSALSSERAKLLRVTPVQTRTAVIPRGERLKLSAEQVVHREVKRRQEVAGHVLISGEHGTGRTETARSLIGGSTVATIAADAWATESGDADDAERESSGVNALRAAVTRHSGGLPGPDFVLVEDIDRLSVAARAELASVLAHADGSPRFVLTQTVTTGGDADGYLESLCVSHIQLPPLRGLLFEFDEIVARMLAELRPDGTVRMHADAVDLLKAQPWKGNFTELRGVLNAVLVSTSGALIRAEDLPSRYQRPAGTAKKRLSDLETAERTIIEAALARNDGNKAHTAHELEISRSKLYARLKYFGIG